MFKLNDAGLIFLFAVSQGSADALVRWAGEISFDCQLPK